MSSMKFFPRTNSSPPAANLRRVCATALLACLVMVNSLAAAVPSPTVEGQQLTAKQATQDLRVLQRALTDLHPGVYRYNTPDAITAEFAAAKAEVDGGSDRERMFLLATRLAASVRCGHTWTNPANQSDEFREAMTARPDKLPVHLRLVEGRFLVTASADSAVHSLDEVLAINDVSTSAIVSTLLPYLRADGGNDGKRLSQLSSGVAGGEMDRLFPLLMPPENGRYRLVLQAPDGRSRTASVEAIALSRREQALLASGVPAPDEAWALRVEGDTAWLTLPTFAFWGGGFDANAFLDKAFGRLQRERIPYLVVDLRDNEGGDSAIADTLLSHLLSKPYSIADSRGESAYERVPYDLARYLETWDFGFFDRTGKVSKTNGRNYRMNDQPGGLRELVPASRRFVGKTWALVGPKMSSAGHTLARNLRGSGAAILVGQTTGGNQRGMNGGQLAWVTLPNSRIAIDIPLTAWMPDTAGSDGGIAPDVLALPLFADVRRGTDTEAIAVGKLIAIERGQSRQ